MKNVERIRTDKKLPARAGKPIEGNRAKREGRGKKGGKHAKANLRDSPFPYRAQSPNAPPPRLIHKWHIKHIHFDSVSDSFESEKAVGS
jgi:hypothetical protein